MSSNSQALPRFNKPPVIETVLGIYFRGRDGFTTAHQGLLWHRFFREAFPKLEERLPIDELHERFGEERLAPPMINWQVLNRPPTPRLWAASEDDKHVVQIQSNALFANWQKTSSDAPYRAYSDRREEFAKQLCQVEEFFSGERIGKFEPTTWIVTYINHIPYGGLPEVGSAFAKTVGTWSNQRSDNWLPEPDRVVLDFSFPMPENAGRLNAIMAPVVQLSDKKHMLRMDLTARGQLKSGSVATALAGIDLGHEWVVRGFASLTRPEMHEIWERTQ